MELATLKMVAEYFGYTNLAQFRSDWAKLSPESKTQLRTGLVDGTMSY